MLLGKKQKGDMLSWETQQNFTEEVNPGLRCAGLEFLQDTHPLFPWIGLLHSLSDYTACLRGDGIVFMHFPNFAGKGQLSKPKQMGTGCSASHSEASLCVFCFSFLLPYLRKESEFAQSNSLRPNGLKPTRLLCPWNFTYIRLHKFHLLVWIPVSWWCWHVLRSH